MHITPLEWDTEFFGYRVGRIVLQRDEVPDRDSLLNNDYRLIYVMSEQELPAALTTTLSAKLADRKVLLGKPATTAIVELDEHIIPLKVLSPELFSLVLQSGHYSRFRIDEQFINREYERLYEAWINKTLADQEGVVYGYKVNGSLAGFISLGIKDRAADIGLIAVDELFRNKQIGQKLLDASAHFAQQKTLGRITVVTQEQNTGAMRFYERHGFSVLQKTYIYHLWK
jgi:dTDP-4-amino-4,6-dideoxy-D-galactose acyltransferase